MFESIKSLENSSLRKAVSMFYDTNANAALTVGKAEGDKHVLVFFVET